MYIIYIHAQYCAGLRVQKSDIAQDILVFPVSSGRLICVCVCGPRNGDDAGNDSIFLTTSSRRHVIQHVIQLYWNSKARRLVKENPKQKDFKTFFSKKIKEISGLPNSECQELYGPSQCSRVPSPHQSDR